MKLPKLVKDLTNKRFHKVVVIEYAGKRKGRTMWRCLCDCGNYITTMRQCLIGGDTKSCGCLHEAYLKTGGATHKMSYTRFAKIFYRMRQRCNNPNNGKFYFYGGRGIKCHWSNFEQFRDDMYESYLEHVEKFGEENTTIDRIDNDGHYCKGNCRWATRKEQSRNLRRNKLVTFRGKTQPLSAWAEETGINYDTLFGRLYRSKWSVEKSMTRSIG